VFSAFVSLFVSWRDHVKTTQPNFTNFGGKVALGPRKKLTDFGGNQVHIM